MLQSENVGLMVWSPLAGGLLSGTGAMAAVTPAAGAWNSTSRQSTVTAPTTASTCCAAWPRRAACRRQMALAWLLAQPVVSSVIIGAKRVDQLDDNLAAVGLALTADELAELDKVSALPPEYPGWMHVRQGEYRRQQLREAGLACALGRDARAPPFSGRCSSGSARPGSPGMGAARAPTHRALRQIERLGLRIGLDRDLPRARKPRHAGGMRQRAPAQPLSQGARRDPQMLQPPVRRIRRQRIEACDALLVTHEAHAPAAGPRA